MANVTASMSVPTNVLANQSFVVTMTLANASASAVTVLHIEPSISPAGSAVAGLPSSPQSCSYGMGVPPLGPSNPSSIPATGTLVITWPCVIYAPQPTSLVDLTVPPQMQYLMNAVVTTNDTTAIIYSAPLGFAVSSFINVPSQSTGYAVGPNLNPGSAVFSAPGNSGLLGVLGM